ncbi:MAG: lipopolysaccharide biosynthesis protein [Fimbriimonadaceae bacterium]
MNLLRRAGLDRAVGFTVAGRIANSLAGLAAIFVVARSLNLHEQGYYTTFNNVLAMQVFFELGLGTVILHSASHEVAHLTLNAEGRYVGEDASHRRLADLFQIGAKCYFAIALLFLLILVPVGLLFFRSDIYSNQVIWRTPWILTVGFTGLFLPLSGATSFVEGCGEVTDAARIRLWQGLLANFTLLVVLFAGFRLFATAAGACAQVIGALVWLYRRHKIKLSDLWRTREAAGAVNWWREIWPFQWRMAVSWLSGYFIFQLFTPILFKVQGADVAGRFGLTLAVVNGIMSVSTSWITTKVPRFGSLIAVRRFEELDHIFARSTRFVVGITALFGFLFWLLIAAMRYRGWPIASHFSDDLTLALMVATAVAMNFGFSMASYLRSFKREPFLWMSVASGAANAVMAFLVARPYGARGIAIGSLATSIFFSVGVGLWVFTRKRREWHAEAA